MNELTLTELDMGCSMPQITAASTPQVNHRGEDTQGASDQTLSAACNLAADSSRRAASDIYRALARELIWQTPEESR